MHDLFEIFAKNIMKKLLSLGALASLTTIAFAQTVKPCAELYFSEYIEGSGNNKALEVYNPTNSEVDLTNYRVTRWQNGSSIWDKQFSDTLSGMLKPKDVVVLVIDRRNPAGTGSDTPSAIELQNKADLFLSKDYNRSYSMSFNGDDALSLDRYDATYKTWVLVDIIGKIGERPRTPGGWSDSFPYSTGLGTWYTENKTLIRKAQILTGCDTVAPVKRGLTATCDQAWNPQYFNPSKEWELYPRNYFDSLGTHTSGCATLSSEKVELNATIKLYPNPTINTFWIESSDKIENVSIFNLSGALVKEYSLKEGLSSSESIIKKQSALLSSEGKKVQISCDQWISGVYQVQVKTVNGQILLEKITK